MSVTTEVLNGIETSKETVSKKGEACILVIFGASGDLARRKLLPALYNMSTGANRAEPFDVLGVGRSKMSDEDFRAAMREATSTAKETRDFSESEWKEFSKRLFYFEGDSNDSKMYGNLAQRLQKMRGSGSSANSLFYLSVPPSLAPSIVHGLGDAGMARPEKGWSRVIVEKPFGRDLTSAKGLNSLLHEVFEEKQIYRIDHYLGKETVQNILVFRFGNSLFEPIWNRNYVDFVSITAAETLGVENRASFYEETGALRDMIANHLLQLLTLTAMEPPISFDADSVREQKVQLLKSIRAIKGDDVAMRTVRGQYGEGVINGKRVPAYRDEPGVKKNSNIETYAAVEFHVDNWRWADVPFYVRAGKRLAKPLTEIVIHLKRTPHALFARSKRKHVDPNVITIRIQPSEGISISFEAKRVRSHMETRTVHMDFSYDADKTEVAQTAYETLILDAMQGDATLFTRKDEVEAEWQLITPIEEAWASMSASKFPNYAAGSDGPAESDEMVKRNGHHWHKLASPTE
jgi:glucose-6-phosphate 1-dehydrogenase